MTSVTRSALRVRISTPRTASSAVRRIILKVLTGGVAALAVVFMIMIGAGWLLAVSLQARSDIRSLAAGPPARPAWIALPAGGMAAQAAVVASLSAPETKRSSEARMLDPIGALALVIPASFDNPATTGSIATNSADPAAPNVAAAGLPATPSKLEVHELPLPRPRLAALGPVQNLGIKAEEEARTAIYDITAQIVYLPSGERLEAHSGLGSLMDDPRYVHEKNRGATPPNTYALKLRESLFHGVQAVRLTPVGEGNMFNRDGILAHSYMLGPNGQSNGCVSFKDYPKFLRAYLRGEIDRIVVVSRLTRPPAFAARPGVRSANAL
jgi:hypothetical protein